jgi:hypothetical protein
MKPYDEIVERLRGIESWDHAAPVVRGEFLKHMEGKQYGHGPLRAAWHWFYAGWRSTDDTNGSGAPLATGQEMCQKRE